MNTRALRRALALLILLFALGLSACGASARSDAADAVREYADLLPSVYSRGEPGLLAEVATDEEQNRVLMYILYLKQQRENLDTRLVALEVTGTEILDGGERAIVNTEEQWQYRSVDADTGESSAGYTVADYESEYTLILENGAWLVSEVDVRETSAGDEQN